VEELLIFGRAHSVANGSSATRKLSFAGTCIIVSFPYSCYARTLSRTSSSTPARQAGAHLTARSLAESFGREPKGDACPRNAVIEM
jgi:hypothetical protein